jgi:hypothetical protein
MEKYMTDERSQRARAAAEAGTATRDRLIEEAWSAFRYDFCQADDRMPRFAENIDTITRAHIADVRTALTACLAHLDELARLIAQRDGYADPRQGYLRELTEGDEPGVALNGWGSKR